MAQSHASTAHSGDGAEEDLCEGTEDAVASRIAMDLPGTRRGRRTAPATTTGTSCAQDAACVAL